MNAVDRKRYELINQCYVPFGADHPAAGRMNFLSDQKRTIFWCTDSKKYIIFDHIKEVPGLKVRLTSIKNLSKILCQ